MYIIKSNRALKTKRSWGLHLFWPSKVLRVTQEGWSLPLAFKMEEHCGCQFVKREGTIFCLNKSADTIEKLFKRVSKKKENREENEFVKIYKYIKKESKKPNTLKLKVC